MTDGLDGQGRPGHGSRARAASVRRWRRAGRAGARLSRGDGAAAAWRRWPRSSEKRHAWFECDVTEQAALDRAVSGTTAALGGIDIVVANAGIGSFGTVAVTSPWKRRSASSR